MGKFKYTLEAKILFYIKYFIFKFLLIWFEVKKPKLKMFIYELLYSYSKFFNYWIPLNSPFRTENIKTKFGEFRVRPGTFDMSVVSPAYERLDIDYLLKIIRRLIMENKRIFFVDIGANIGLYSVVVGNIIRNYKNTAVKIIAIEPELSAYDILKKNLSINYLDAEIAEPFNLEISSVNNPQSDFQSNKENNNQRNSVVTLDSLIGNKLSNFDTVVIKIDTEGKEVDIFRGADKLLDSGKEIYILLEDFINPLIIQYITGRGLDFVYKFTPYNSWWYSPPREYLCVA